MIGAVDPIVITGIGPMCPGATRPQDLAAAWPSSTFDAASSVDWFDEERFLGKRGYKYLTPATRYLLAAVGQALNDAAISDETYAPPERGVVVGTNFAVHRTLASMDRTILCDGAAALQPMYAPNFSVNIPASHVSIRHRCRAFNVTLTDALVGGIHALVLGGAAMTEGRAGMVIAAATEEAPPPTLGEETDTLQGGACALTLERLSGARRRHARVYGAVVGRACAFLGRPDNLSERQVSVIERAFRALGIEPGRSIDYACVGPRDAVQRGTNEALHHIAARLGVRLVDLAPEATPGCPLFSVSPVIYLATMMMRATSALLVTTSPQGHLAMIALQPAEASS